MTKYKIIMGIESLTSRVDINCINIVVYVLHTVLPTMIADALYNRSTDIEGNVSRVIDLIREANNIPLDIDNTRFDILYDELIVIDIYSDVDTLDYLSQVVISTWKHFLQTPINQIKQDYPTRDIDAVITTRVYSDSFELLIGVEYD